MDPKNVDESCTISHSDGHEIRELPTEILYEILGHLDTRNLLLCRLINWTWVTLANLILEKVQKDQTTLQMDFVHSESRGCYILKKERSVLPRATLDLFNRCLSNTREVNRFPCKDFAFYGNLAEDDVQAFLRLYGHQIRNLILSLPPEINSMNVRALENLLNEQAPNLKMLHLSLTQEWLEYPSHDQTDESDSDGDESHEKMEPFSKLVLPSLESLKTNLDFRTKTPIIVSILEGAVNLKYFENSTHGTGIMMDMDLYFPIFLTMSKIHTLTTLNFNPKANQESMALYDQIAQVTPGMTNLKKLSLGFQQIWRPPQWWTRTGAALLKIMRDCHQNLKILELNQPLEFLTPGLSQMPNFPQVTDLHLSMNGCGLDPQPTFSLLPIGRQWDTFPCLHFVTVSLCTPLPAEEHWDNLVRHAQSPILTVGHLYLDIYDAIPLTLMEKFSLVFPNVNELEVTLMISINLCVAGILKYFTRIKMLRLLLEMFSRDEDEEDAEIIMADYHLNLDPTLTGFSRETCTRLRNEGPRVDEDFAILRENPSILDLKDLVELQIRINEDDDTEKDSYQIFTLVTAQYAFKDMRPDFLVRISIEASLDANKDHITNSLTPLVVDYENIEIVDYFD